jgi:hypothetical protein
MEPESEVWGEWVGCVLCGLSCSGVVLVQDIEGMTV